MNILLTQFKQAQAKFLTDRNKEDGTEVMVKITALVNDLGQNFTTMDGGELSETQMKLAGYSFYLSDYIAELNQISEALKLQIKEVKATRWDQVMEEIKAVEGKVKNKEQVENVITTETIELAREQILYENLFYKYKLKLSALGDIQTAIVQRLAELKRQIEQSKRL